MVLLGRSVACKGEGPTRTSSNEWGGAGGSKLSFHPLGRLGLRGVAFLCTLGESAFIAPLWLHIHSTEALAGRGTMGRVVTLVGNLALGIVALLCGASGQVRAASPPQQFDASNFQAAATKASEYCTTLWSDHAFDPLRDKIPLLGGQPTSSMLTNPQRVRPEDKPLADLALKTAEKCKAAAAYRVGNAATTGACQGAQTYTAVGCVKYPTL